MASANDSRQAILARIREGLKTPAIRPPAALQTPVFPPPSADIVETFRHRCNENLVDCILTANRPESKATLRQSLLSVPAGEVFAQDTADLRDLLADCDHKVQWSSRGAPLEGAQATITHCEALVAATGTIIVSAECGGRGGSVIAPVHVVIANSTQLVPDLDSAMARLHQRGTYHRNSFVGFITGCSRTADIEKILVIGAHGPRRVVVILENDK
jgi:L-lactate dehydrogenase complex protein LldG